MAFVPDTQPATKSRFVPDSAAAPAEAPAAATAPDEPSTAGKIARGAGDLLVNQNPLVGIIEKLGQGVTGLVSKIGSGYAGLAHAAGNAVGLTHGDPADTVRAVQEAGTYQPRTNAAKIIDQAGAAVEKPFEVPGQAIDRAVQNSNSPVVQAVAPAAAEAVTDIAGLAAPGKVGARVAEGAAAPTVVEGAAKPAVGAGKTAIETGRSAGFKYTPGGAESRMPAAALNGDVPQSFAVSAGDRREINLHNQARATELAGQTLGKEGATELAPKDFQDAKAPHQQVYTDTGQMLGTGLTGSEDFVNGLRARLADDSQTQLKGQVKTQTQRILNAAQSGNMSGPQMVKDISWLRQNGGRSVAKMLEQEIETQLGANSPQLEKFRDARTGLAQINNIQEVTKGGQVDANALARIDQQNPGLLTGNLKVIAQSAGAAPQDFRLPSGVQPGSSPVSKPTLLGAAKSLAGGMAKVVAPSRFDVTSDAFQRRFGREATPTEQTYMQDFGRKVGPASERFQLQQPPGSTGVVPRQGEIELPPGQPPRPVVDLAPPEGEIGEGPSRQIGMELAQGRPLDEQRLSLAPTEGSIEPHQPTLLGHPGTPEGGSKLPKAKKRGKD